MAYLCFPVLHIWQESACPPVAEPIQPFAVKHRDTAYTWHSKLGQQFTDKNGKRGFLTGHIEARGSDRANP